MADYLVKMTPATGAASCSQIIAVSMGLDLTETGAVLRMVLDLR